MEYEKWKIFYISIINDFGYSEDEDIESAKILDNILRNKDVDVVFERLRSLINGKEVVVFGAGPSLLKSIDKYRKLIERLTKISADGATSALLEKGITPDIVITDLDGKIEDLLKADEEGSIVVIHAHGDNMDKIKEFGSKFSNTIGTTQVDSSKFERLFNFGGFTDGDRAAFLAKALNASKIYLIGFDFDGEIGEYSFTRDIAIKRKKLEWCRRLLKEIDDLVFLT